MSLITRVRLVLCGLVPLLLVACQDSGPVSSPGPSSSAIKVVATTTVVADLARTIGGSGVVVEQLMGPGIDPHLYKASARDVTLMAEADLILYNGLFLEGKMAEVLAQMSAQGVATHAVAECIPDSLLKESAYFQGNYDPHVWLEPRLWKLAAREVAGQLSAMAPAFQDTFQVRWATYAEALRAADAYAREAVEQIDSAHRVLITSHDAFAYYGRAFGLEVVGLQGISTATEAGTADVQRVSRLVLERRIPAMFVESSISPRGIEAVQEATRARGFEVQIGGMLYGDALGMPGSATGTLLGMIRHNTDTIVAALTDGPGD